MSFCINSCTISGNLGRDPEVRYVGQNKTPLCEFSVAVTHSRKVGDKWEEETSWISCKAWNKQGEWCGQNLHKGSGVVVHGALREESWDDKESGKKRSKITVVAERVQPLERMGKGGESRRSSEPVESGDDDSAPF